MADVIIIGAGTAGLSAAIYVQRAGKSALVLEAKAAGGQIINTPDIENYPGIAHISGFDFASGLLTQATELGAEVRYEKAEEVTRSEEGFTVRTSKNEYAAKAVILATGAKNRPLGLPREEELIGRGVSYCATCDGMFMRGKETAVNGGGNTALEDAEFLSNYCTKVYVIHRRDEFRGDEKTVEILKGKENVEFVLNSTVSAILGEKRVEGVEVTNKITGEKTVLPVSGLFIAIGQMPENGPFENVAELDPKGYFDSGESLLTKTPGVFVAGDCRTKEVRQLTTAASDGAVAALAACRFIDGH